MDFIRQIFQDCLGTYSSKRTITFVAFTLLCVAFVCNLFWGMKIAQPLLDSVTYIILFGIGAATAEPMANSKFLLKNKD